MKMFPGFQESNLNRLPLNRSEIWEEGPKALEKDGGSMESPRSGPARFQRQLSFCPATISPASFTYDDPGPWRDSRVSSCTCGGGLFPLKLRRYPDADLFRSRISPMRLRGNSKRQHVPSGIRPGDPTGGGEGVEVRVIPGSVQRTPALSEGISSSPSPARVTDLAPPRPVGVPAAGDEPHAPGVAHGAGRGHGGPTSGDSNGM